MQPQRLPSANWTVLIGISKFIWPSLGSVKGPIFLTGQDDPLALNVHLFMLPGLHDLWGRMRAAKPGGVALVESWPISAHLEREEESVCFKIVNSGCKSKEVAEPTRRLSSWDTFFWIGKHMLRTCQLLLRQQRVGRTHSQIVKNSILLTKETADLWNGNDTCVINPNLFPPAHVTRMV